MTALHPNTGRRRGNPGKITVTMHGGIVDGRSYTYQKPLPDLLVIAEQVSEYGLRYHDYLRVGDTPTYRAATTGKQER
jgi:hypothetical protein